MFTVVYDNRKTSPGTARPLLLLPPPAHIRRHNLFLNIRQTGIDRTFTTLYGSFSIIIIYNVLMYTRYRAGEESRGYSEIPDL